MLDASARQGILKPIRLVIVDRQPIVLQGLRSVLGAQQDFDVVASSSDGTRCLEALRNLTPDVALIGDTLPDLSAPEILAITKAEKLSTRLVFFTESDADHDLGEAIAAGACSAISKYAAPAAMLHSLRLMAKSGVSLEPRDLSPRADEAEGGKIEKMLELLTERERQIARLVSEGLSNKEIARKLDVSQGTVKVHLYNIFQKLEITNRTVLATIALLQRTSGFGALALAFLAFAVADELEASETNHVSPEDNDAGPAGEHAAYDVWKKAILQRLVLSDVGDSHRITGRDFFTKASQATNPAAAMQALCAAEQFMGSKPWKDLGPGGSITPSLAALLLQPTRDAQSDSDHSLSNHLPRLASEAMIHGGHATFVALAGALIYALSDTEAAAHGLDQASIDGLSAGIGDDATTSLAGTTDLAANHREDTAADFRSHHFGNAGREDAHGQTAEDADGYHLQNPVGAVAHESDPGIDGRGQLLADNVERVAGRSSNDSTSNSSDSVWDFEAGPDRLNLAAFGALAFLHLTAAAKSIPPHTLAWVYDPTTNETIVYVNPTDRVLEVGDRGLMEIHLQGIVSVAESDVVHHAGGAVVADTLEQLEGALIPAIATDESGPSTDDIEGRASSDEAAGVWRALADDGSGFRFAEARTGTSTKFKTSTRDSTEAMEESAGGSGVSAYGSTVAPGHSATISVVEKLSASSEPTKADTGAPSAQQNEKVPPGLATADGTSPGNSGHAAPASSKATPQSTEPGNGGGEGEHPAPASNGARESAAETSAPPEHGSSGHGHHPASNAPADAVDSAGSGHSHHALEQGATGAKPGKGVGEDAEHQAPASEAKGAAAEGAAAETKSAPVEHGNSGHGQHPSSANEPAADTTADTAGGSLPHLPSGQGAAKAAAKSGGDHGSAGHRGGESAQQAAHSGAEGSEVAKPVEVASARGADHEAVFRFDGGAGPSTPDTASGLKKSGDLHVPRGQNDHTQMMVETTLDVPDEPAAQHGNHDGHHGPPGHDWLI